MIRPSTPRRGPERTIRIFERIQARYKFQVEFLGFGASDEELASAGLQRPWLSNLGKLSPPEVALLLRNCDIFCDLSDYQAMGLTLLEAMLSGCLVIGPELGGASSFITNDVSGILVDTRYDEAIFTAISKAINSLAPNKAIPRKGRSKANDNIAQCESIRRRGIEVANTLLPEACALNLVNELFQDA